MISLILLLSFFLENFQLKKVLTKKEIVVKVEPTLHIYNKNERFFSLNFLHHYFKQLSKKNMI